MLKRNKTCQLGSGENENGVRLQFEEGGWTFETGTFGPGMLVKKGRRPLGFLEEEWCSSVLGLCCAKYLLAINSNAISNLGEEIMSQSRFLTLQQAT